MELLLNLLSCLLLFPLVQEAAKDTKQEQSEKKDDPKFQPFTGKKYSLRG